MIHTTLTRFCSGNMLSAICRSAGWACDPHLHLSPPSTPTPPTSIALLLPPSLPTPFPPRCPAVFPPSPRAQLAGTAAAPPEVAWVRGLDAHAAPLKEFSVTFSEALRNLPLGVRLWSHNQREKSQGRVPVIDPFSRETQPSACHGVPLGGIGACSIGRGFQGEFNRWQFAAGQCEDAPVEADQFSVFITRQAESPADQPLKFSSVLYPGVPKGVRRKASGSGIDAWGWNMDGSRSTYYALFPRAWTVYQEPDPEMTISCRQVSPFIPNNYQESSLPSSVFAFTVANTGTTAAEVTLVFSLANSIGGDSAATGGHLNTAFEMDRGIKGVKLQHRSSKVGGPVTLAIAARGGSGATNTAPPSATSATMSSPIAADSANGIADPACRAADSTNGIADSGTDEVRVSVCPHFVLSGPCKGLSAADMWQHLEKTGTFPPHHESALASHPSFPGTAIGAAVAASVSVAPGATRHVDFTLCWDVPVARFNPDSHYLRRYTRFYGHHGMAAHLLARDALLGYSNWETAIDAWQQPILQDDSLPEWYGMHVAAPLPVHAPHDMHGGPRLEEREQHEWLNPQDPSHSLARSVLLSPLPSVKDEQGKAVEPAPLPPSLPKNLLPLDSPALPASTLPRASSAPITPARLLSSTSTLFSNMAIGLFPASPMPLPTRKPAAGVASGGGLSASSSLTPPVFGPSLSSILSLSPQVNPQVGQRDLRSGLSLNEADFAAQSPLVDFQAGKRDLRSGSSLNDAGLAVGFMGSIGSIGRISERQEEEEDAEREGGGEGRTNYGVGSMVLDSTRSDVGGATAGGGERGSSGAQGAEAVFEALQEGASTRSSSNNADTPQSASRSSDTTSASAPSPFSLSSTPPQPRTSLTPPPRPSLSLASTQQPSSHLPPPLTPHEKALDLPAPMAGRLAGGPLGPHEHYSWRLYDVHFYASFALLALFPLLELSLQRDFAVSTLLQQRRMTRFLADGASGVNKTRGSVPHDLGCHDPWVFPNAYNIHDTAQWKDLNCKFVLQVCRDYRATGNVRFCRAVWAAVVAAMDAVERFDRDDDGLIENDGFPDQTYDNWPVHGVSAYCGGLWLAALQAGAAMADAVGEAKYAQYWRRQCERGREAFVAKLWNGRYFNYDSGSSSNSNSIHADQLAGQWYLWSCGLPPLFDSAMACKALQMIFEYNVMRLEGGSMGAVNGMRPNGQVDDTCLQSREVWTGVTYGLAATMIYEGMHSQAFRTAQGIHQAGWDELGYWFQTPEGWDTDGRFRSLAYMRPLAIWAMHSALNRGKITSSQKRA
ncbi:unnamed protein product [Closterium sp. NIES-64]|nr:unnamed protein product [Closterium sp. NIES-64]